MMKGLFSQIESLYPEEMEKDKMSVKQFLEEGLPVINKAMARKAEVAAIAGKALRYVATLENRR